MLPKPQKPRVATRQQSENTFSHSQLHRTLQALCSWPTIQGHYGPYSTPVTPNALAARWLGKLASLDNESEHRSGKDFRHADSRSRLPATTTALNITTTMDADASVVGHLSSRNLASSDISTPPAQQPQITTIPRDSAKSNQTDEGQSDVSNGNAAGENKSNQTDDEPPEVEYCHEAGANKPVSQFTLIEQQGDFPNSAAYCISADNKLGAGIAEQIEERFPSCYKRPVTNAMWKCLLPIVLIVENARVPQRNISIVYEHGHPVPIFNG